MIDWLDNFLLSGALPWVGKRLLIGAVAVTTAVAFHDFGLMVFSAIGLLILIPLALFYIGHFILKLWDKVML